jgi:hypothetical protein
VSQNVATGENTTLSCPRQGRNFNWADVTLEVYGIDECAEFAEGEMTFSDVKLWDTEMKPMEVPEKDWLLTSPNKPGLCKGEIKVVDDDNRPDPEAEAAAGEEGGGGGAGGGTSFTIEHVPGEL